MPGVRLIKQLVWVSSLAVWLIACSVHTEAPVIAGQPAPKANQNVHTVKAGETLYSIAFRYGLDYRELARFNRLAPPYVLDIGEKVQLHQRASAKALKPTKKPQKFAKKRVISGTKRPKALSKVVRREVYKPVRHWRWPAQGKVIKRYAPAAGSKGIDIAGVQRSAIKAAAAGEVAYAGNGLRGYGNLVILKHNSVYLSAYAHNAKLLVKEGQWIKAGQTIALMGKTGAKRVQLHFEIRKAGKPVNPLRYLRKFVAGRKYDRHG